MRNQLINRLSINDIYSLCLQTQGKENNCLKEELYQLTFDENERVAFNALWALSHFDEANNPWLFQKQVGMISKQKRCFRLVKDSPLFEELNAMSLSELCR